MKTKVLFHSLVSDKYSLAWKFVFWTNCALLLYLTLSPDVYHRPTFSNVDKVYHFIGFSTFTVLLAFAFPNLKLTIVFILGLILGGLVEFTQQFVPHRNASIGDFLADFAGIAIAIGLVVFIRRKVN